MSGSHVRKVDPSKGVLSSVGRCGWVVRVESWLGCDSVPDRGHGNVVCV